MDWVDGRCIGSSGFDIPFVLPRRTGRWRDSALLDRLLSETSKTKVNAKSEARYSIHSLDDSTKDDVQIGTCRCR